MAVRAIVVGERRGVAQHEGGTADGYSVRAIWMLNQRQGVICRSAWNSKCSAWWQSEGECPQARGDGDQVEFVDDGEVLHERGSLPTHAHVDLQLHRISREAYQANGPGRGPASTCSATMGARPAATADLARDSSRLGIRLYHADGKCKADIDV